MGLLKILLIGVLVVAAFMTMTAAIHAAAPYIAAFIIIFVIGFIIYKFLPKDEDDKEQR